MKRVIAVLTSVALVLGTLAVRADATPSFGDRHESAVATAAGFTFPLSANVPGQGSFNGTLRIVRFAVAEGKLVALAVVTGTRVDEAGVTRGVVRMVSLPVAASPTALASGPTAQLTCEVLHLELGPLDLDLLGLVVHLDRVVLDISAVTGAGALLGNLLCAITNLLNGVGSLATIAALLNQLVGLLG